MMKRPTDPRYLPFLNTLARPQWLKIGLARRAGVATPLFSIHSASSVGVGDSEDLKKLVDWCEVTGLTLIQLLPLNDVGFNFWPYDSQSIFALEPMHLALDHLTGIPSEKYSAVIQTLREKFPCHGIAYDSRIKKAKLELLRRIFIENSHRLPPAFQAYVETERFWLEDYVLFKAAQGKFYDAPWEAWPDDFKFRNPAALQTLTQDYAEDLKFQRWLQWQLFEQFKNAKQYAEERGICIMGDMPYLCSRNSDYVWAHQDHFKLELSSGAPPDLDFAKGQRWGMPPYQWPAIAATGYESLIRKLRYAENFYHMYRIDHVVGIFRVWTIANHHAIEDHGLHGVFDPANEWDWEGHGRNLLSVMLKNTTMLACAEDLGTVPECAVRVMGEFGIPGLDIQRWNKDWTHGADFKALQDYRLSSLAAVSTHDTSSLRAWWKYEIETVNGPVFERWCQMAGLDFGALRDTLFDLSRSQYGRLVWRPEMKDRDHFLRTVGRRAEEIPILMNFYDGSIREREQFERLLFGESVPPRYELSIEKHILKTCLQSSSLFSIQLLQDWLSLDHHFKEPSAYDYRINFPSTLNDKNWRLRIPYSMEELMNFVKNRTIRELVKSTERI